jgi:prepilin-type N-terminal cleavage/methylation domain-containing protein
MQNLKSFKKDIPQALKKCSCVFLVSRRGQSFIELLAAITLFSIVVMIAVGSFVNVLKTQRQVAALSAAESNLGVVIEQMAREIRTGSLFCSDINGNPDPVCNCIASIDAEGNSIETCPTLTFIDADGNNVEYALNVSGILEKSVGSSTQEITGSNVKVQYLDFILFGNSPTDHWNPRITVTLGMQPNDISPSGNVLNLETTISARQIDCTQGNPPSC